MANVELTVCELNSLKELLETVIPKLGNELVIEGIYTDSEYVEFSQSVLNKLTKTLLRGKYTDKDKEAFLKYAKVQIKGKYNLITESNLAREEMGITVEEYKFILYNYNELRELFSEDYEKIEKEYLNKLKKMKQLNLTNDELELLKDLLEDRVPRIGTSILYGNEIDTIEYKELHQSILDKINKIINL